MGLMLPINAKVLLYLKMQFFIVENEQLIETGTIDITVPKCNIY